MSDSSSFLIGIDGGGTRCRFALQTDKGREVIELGAANVFSDREQAIATLNAGVLQLMQRAGLPAEYLADISCYAGVAGVLGAEDAAQVAQALPCRRVRVEDDRHAAVVGALGGAQGVLAGIGTGSFLAAQTGDGVRYLGGYGLMMGDDASGAWLGREVLRQALLHLDGMADGSPLIHRVLTRFDGAAGQIVAFSASAAPADYARFAPDIVRAAQGGDATGLMLMQRGAAYIARGIGVLGHRPGTGICLLGGVAGEYSAYLPPALQRDLCPPQGTALDGALMLAHELARELTRDLPSDPSAEDVSK